MTSTQWRAMRLGLIKLSARAARMHCEVRSTKQAQQLAFLEEFPAWSEPTSAPCLISLYSRLSKPMGTPAGIPR